jgi:hypothetical protein
MLDNPHCPARFVPCGAIIWQHGTDLVAVWFRSINVKKILRHACSSPHARSGHMPLGPHVAAAMIADRADYARTHHC